MHQCKLIEHDRYTCPESIVPCVNVSYGCTELLKRKYLTAHIEHCPASAVVCSFSYERSEMPTTQSLEDKDKFEGDITAHIEHHSASTLVCHFSYESSDMPKTESAENGTEMIQLKEKEMSDKYDLLIDEKFLQGDLSVRKSTTQDAVSGGSEKDVVSWYTGSYLKQLQGLGATEMTSLSPDLSVEMNMGFLTNFGSSCPRKFKQQLFESQRRTCIDTTVSTKLHHIRNSGQRKKCCSFPCNSVVRRDEFAAHWKSLHVDIQLDIQCLVRRCPMYSYGCNYGVLNLTPNPEGASLDYSKETDCFLYRTPPVQIQSPEGAPLLDSAYTAKIQTKQELAMYGYEDDEDESYDVLGQLPAEVLMAICSFLDSQSLWQLSQVNHYLRKVCLNLVKKAGVVYSEWEKDRSGSWTKGPKVCIHVLNYLL